MFKRLIKLLPLTSLLLLLFSPKMAAAHGGPNVWCWNCATDSTAQGILATLSTGVDRIVGAIQGASTAQTTASQESAKVISEANAANSAVVQQNDLERSGRLLDPCGVTAVSQGVSAASSGGSRPSGVGRGSGGGGGATPTRGASADMVKALEISNGDRAAPPPEVTAALAASGACTTFVSGGSRGRVCSGAGYAPAASSGFPNADITAETIFDGPQSADELASKQIKRKLTISSDNGPDRVAINGFVRNMETPMDLRELQPVELRREAGRNYMALKDSYEARMSLSTKPLRDQISMTTVNRDTLPILRQMMLGEDAPFVQDYLTRAYPRWNVEGISYAQLLDLEASKRYLNPKWQVRMAAANEKQLLAEQVQMQALASWTNTLLLERQQQQSILIGGLAGSNFRAELLPQMRAQHNAAISR